MFNRFLRCLWILTLLQPVMVLSQVASPLNPSETVKVLRDAPLRVDRFEDAAILRTIAAGSSAQILSLDAGWVLIRVEKVTGWVRASALASTGSIASSVSRLESGRTLSGNVLAVSGVRAVPKQAHHALILSALTTADPFAGEVARLMGVPPDNLHQLNSEQWSQTNLQQAIDQVSSRLKGTNKLLVVIDSPSRVSKRLSKECEWEWSSRADSTSPLSASMVTAKLEPLRGRLDKLLLLVVGETLASDECQVAGKATPPKILTAPLPRTTQDPALLGLSDAHLAQVKIGAGNLEAWAKCMAGEAVDADGSGGLSVAEIAACADQNAQTFSGGGMIPAPALVASLQSAPGLSPADTGVSLFRDLFAQRSASRDFAVQARTDLTIGTDQFSIAVTSPREGYVSLILLGSDGTSIYQLFPNTLDQDHRILAQHTMTLPRATWQVRAAGPAGTNTLLILVSDRPQPLPLVSGEAAGPFVRLPNNPQVRTALQAWAAQMHLDGANGRQQNHYGAQMLRVIEH
jgi:Domain of unknown function (DUF4384)